VDHLRHPREDVFYNTRVSRPRQEVYAMRS
jgi:hypothetical protein